jgi:hypothetical protein
VSPVNPIIAKYLLGVPWRQDEVEPPMADPSALPPVDYAPPSWQQGASAAPEAPPSQPQPDLMAYFRALKPELFSQEAVDSAMAGDAETNARNAGLRRMESGAAGYGLRAPNYAGMEPTEAGMRGLQARQQQALQSADVGGKVGSMMNAAAVSDPTSPVSMKAYAAAMNDPNLAPVVGRLGRLGQVSKADIDQALGLTKTGGEIGIQGATKVKDLAAGASSQAEADTKNALRPGAVEAQGYTNADLALKPAATRAGTAETNARTRKIDADIEAAKATTSGANAEKAGKTEAELRKEFQGTPMFTKANEVNDAYRKVLAAPPDPKGDLALVYSYVKILDPGSVVREGEIQLSKEGRSYETQVRAWLTKAQTGEGFTPQERAQFRGSAKALYDSQMQSYRAASENYRRLATERGANPGNVVLDMNIGGDAPDDAGGGWKPASAREVK